MTQISKVKKTFSAANKKITHDKAESEITS